MKITPFLNSLLERAAKEPKTIVLPEGEDERILDAAHTVAERKAAKLIILGNPEEIKAYYAKNNWSLDGIELLKPETSEKLAAYTDLLYELRKAKGMTPNDAKKLALNYNYFGTLMIKAGDADGMVSGANHSTADTVRPALQIIKSAHKGMVDKMRNATKLAQEMLKSDEYKNLPIMIDGEMQADAALDLVVAKKKAPDSQVAGHANVLIFPCLEVGNISYKLLQRLCGCEAYGPMLQGLNAPVNDLSRGALTEDIVGMIAITAIQAVK